MSKQVIKKKEIIKKVTDFRETGDAVVRTNLALISLIAEQLTPIVANGGGLSHDKVMSLSTKLQPLLEENTQAIQAYLDALVGDYTSAIYELSNLEVKNG